MTHLALVPVLPVAHLDGVSQHYGKTVALNNITLDIPARCMVGLIGPDGVGKSSLLSLISGALSVMAGVMLLVYPNAGKWVLSLLFPLWFIAHCISRLAGLNAVSFFAGRAAYWFTLILNILGLILGAMMLFDPWVSLLSLQYIVAFYLVLLGADCILLAFSRIGLRE